MAVANTLAYYNMVTKTTVKGFIHRDKTRVQMPAKIFPQLKVKC